MTLLELCKLLRRHLGACVVVPLVCAVVCAAGAALWPATYEATASMVVSSEAGPIGAIAEQLGAQVFSSEISVTTNTTAKSISIEAKGENEQAVVRDANAVLEDAQDELVTMYPKTPEADEEGNVPEATESTISVTASEATAAANAGKSPALYGVVGLLAGLFCAIAVIVIVDMVKTPVHTKEEAEAIAELPVLEMLPCKDDGAKLKANIEFANGASPKQLCIVPVGEMNAEEVSALTNCKATAPLSQGIDAAIQAKAADATILLVKEFVSSTSDLVDTVNQLKLAKANTIGIVYEK